MNPLLTGLVDDAGLFPPSLLPMSEAVARFRASDHPMLTGRFLCPVYRFEELVAELDAPITVHLIADSPFALPHHPQVTVSGVELRSGLMTQVPCYVEGVPPLDLAGTGAFGKVRCGGERIPAIEQLAHYVRSCVRFSLPFKGTAGMHAAVRGWESTNGQPHHGYLNLLLAVARALNGGDVDEVLASTDGPALAAEARSLDADQVLATRGLFRSYGSCDTARPITDAHELGLL